MSEDFVAGGRRFDVIRNRRSPVQFRAYRLEEIREAVRYAETFHTRGKLVIEI